MADNVKKDSLVVNCPFCGSKSVLGKLAVICPHLIASINSWDEVLSISKDFDNLLKIEGLPIKTLRDFLSLKVSIGEVKVSKFDMVNESLIDEYFYLMDFFNYYSDNRYSLLDDFKNSLMNACFKTVSININLREAYWLYSIFFENGSQNQEKKIRPTFSYNGINLDWERVPFEIINYIFGDLVEEQIIKPNIIKKWEAGKEADKRELFEKYILGNSISFDNKKLLKYLIDKYGTNEQFYSLFKELEYSEEADAIEEHYEVMARNIHGWGFGEQVKLESFSEFESSHILKTLFVKRVWPYASSNEIDGAMSGLRNFIVEIINYFCRQYSIKYRYASFSEKLNKLKELEIIDELLKLDLNHLHKVQSYIIHDPKQIKENRRRLDQVKNTVSENILPKFVTILNSLKNKR